MTMHGMVAHWGENEPPGTARGVFPTPEAPMTVRSYAKEDPWQDDDDGNHGRPVTLARMGDGPDTEAIWTAVRGAWQPFPDLWARRCFDAEAL